MENEAMKDSACVAARESREIELGRAIDEIDDVIIRADTLLSRITNGGGNTPTGSDKVTTTVNPYTLQLIMNEGAENIRGKISRLHDLLNTIEQTIL